MKAYEDPNHSSNKIRPRLKCWACGKLGCVGKHWGQWCFDCNIKRINKISAVLENMESAESYHCRMAEKAVTL